MNAHGHDSQPGQEVECGEEDEGHGHLTLNVELFRYLGQADGGQDAEAEVEAVDEAPALDEAEDAGAHGDVEHNQHHAEPLGKPQSRLGTVKELCGSVLCHFHVVLCLPAPFHVSPALLTLHEHLTGPSLLVLTEVYLLLGRGSVAAARGRLGPGERGGHGGPRHAEVERQEGDPGQRAGDREELARGGAGAVAIVAWKKIRIFF